MANIFISYNHHVKEITTNLDNDIKALGHTVWYDQELSGGQAWWDKILASIRNCDVFVFVLDPMTLNSAACKSEYGYAAALGKTILPVLVSEGVSIKLLPHELLLIQYVDYKKQDREAALRLAKAFTTIPPSKPLSDPLPLPPEAPISYLGSLAEQVETTAALSYERQSALLLELKKSLRDQETTDDTRTLLVKLRKRHDLFETVAEEIDELLRSPRPVPSVGGQKKLTVLWQLIYRKRVLAFILFLLVVFGIIGYFTDKGPETDIQKNKDASNKEDTITEGKKQAYYDTTTMQVFPSFDCRKASTAAERLICSNSELSQAEAQMAQTYKIALRKTIDKSALKREQIMWLRNSRDVCEDASTMLKVIQERTDQLSRY
jgi:uncharacterized protein YecT (DUF1311 family)